MPVTSLSYQLEVKHMRRVSVLSRPHLCPVGLLLSHTHKDGWCAISTKILLQILAHRTYERHSLNCFYIVIEVVPMFKNLCS